MYFRKEILNCINNASHIKFFIHANEKQEQFCTIYYANDTRLFLKMPSFKLNIRTADVIQCRLSLILRVAVVQKIEEENNSRTAPLLFIPKISRF